MRGSKRIEIIDLPADNMHHELAEVFVDSGDQGAMVLQRILDPNTPLEEVEATQKMITDTVASMRKPVDEEKLALVDIKDLIIKPKCEGAIETKALIVTPKKEVDGKRSCLVDIHGGGLYSFSYWLEKRNHVNRALENDCVVFSPEYAPIPQNIWSDTMDMLESSIDWLIENAEELNIDLNRVVVTGLSSGAHLAAALSHRLKVRNAEGDATQFQFAAQVLQSPILDDRPMYKSSALSYGDWKNEQSRWAISAWLGDIYNSPYVPEDAMPMRAKTFKGLPATCIHIGELDHDRDSQIQYAQNIIDAGIYTDIHFWGGGSHVSWVLHPGNDRSKMVRETIKKNIKDGLTGKLVRG